MSRLFDDAASDKLGNTADAPPVTGPPFTVCCWFRSNDITKAQALNELRNGITDHYYRLDARGDQAGDPLFFTKRNTGQSNAEAETTTGYTANVWHHAAGVHTSATDTACFIDGGSKDTNTLSRTPTGIDKIHIGVQDEASPSTFMSGNIANMAIWNVALTDAEIATLAEGVSPLRVRRDALVYFCPIGGQSPEIDIIGNVNMTVTGTVVDEEPPIPYSLVAMG